ncbi:uncharacterized protein [Macrobrachium rosenbergii]|uniref:uncharacterized protein n=1 Tax=Macrobrachium rosenbergii TaxID=79674 RepID=UPI0034D532C1
MYLDNCKPQVCAEGSWVEVDHLDQYCCSDIYYKLQYGIISTVVWDTYTETTSGENIMTMSQKTNTFSGTSTTGGITLARSRRGIYWENIYNYNFPWWFDNNGNTSWYEEYAGSQNELKKDNLVLNGIAYTGSCEKLVCIGKDHINKTGEFHPKCCFHNGDWYHHGYPLYTEGCSAQVCSAGNWVQLVEYSDPYCCSAWSNNDWYYWGWSYGYAGTLTRYRFRWWYENAKWQNEYYNSDHYNTYYASLNNSLYDSVCRRYVCTGRNTLNITEEIKEDCCEYNMTWYHHGLPIYKDDCIGYVCLNGSWLQTDYTDPKCCWNPDTDFQYNNYNEYDYDSYQNSQFKSWYKVNETRTRFMADCQEVTCASRNNWVSTGVVIPDCELDEGDRILQTFENNKATYHESYTLKFETAKLKRKRKSLCKTKDDDDAPSAKYTRSRQGR